MDTPVCLHCDKAPPRTSLGLCERCFARRAIRRLYVRRRDWTPAWEAHLRRLADRAREGLPLFPDPTPPEVADATKPSDRTGGDAEGGGAGPAAG